MPWKPFTLNDGNVMPGIAYGTWRTGKDQEAIDFAQQAISAGIYHIDTAQNYRNEAEAGIAIRESGLPREKIFVTTKWSRLNGLDIATSFQNSLKELNISYIDLYLIHGAELCDDIPSCWKEMEKIKDSGLAKSIGVSNFEVADLEQLFTVSKYTPTVNQILFHPYVYEESLPILDICKQEGIIVEAYSPLIPVTKYPGKSVDKISSSIARRLSATNDQVLLAWAKAKGTVPVTNSKKKQRLEGFVKAGDLMLTPDDIASIDEAGKDV
ncbi:NAD/NADP-dependent indole-3-acetaldehyde reductase [Psilocybe cubensis]|uniref:NADP-dependent oxidoreductase domain-containing protein n=2 Tax=Psilocybe cubensis TaxID=181762 RepID=A0A8H7XUW2_PSICU|nr:NAD/NADP-dependent indole-3-acetaldehyde reductase [Psilocybe cubensis]KAH9476064.1 NAD/NADP-dependent indole-3-acetaldehyde reductase [Psilocybe cubensis]